MCWWSDGTTAYRFTIATLTCITSEEAAVVVQLGVEIMAFPCFLVFLKQKSLLFCIVGYCCFHLQSHKMSFSVALQSSISFYFNHEKLLLILVLSCCIMTVEFCKEFL